MQASLRYDRLVKPQQSSSLPCVDGMSGPENKETAHSSGALVLLSFEIFC